MPLNKIRQRPSTYTMPNAPTDEWAYMEVINDLLQFNSDGSNTRTVVTLNQTQTLTNKTLTSPTITGATLTSPTISGPANVEVVTATNVITATESGKVFFLNSGTEFASTLPAPSAGLEYTFIVTAAPASASYTVVTEGGCQVLAGHILTSGFADSGSDVETTATGTTVTFVDGVSVVGDRCHVISDGTSWFASCICAVEAGITITG